MSKQPPPAPTASAVGPCLTLIQMSRTPRHWKFTQHHRTTRPPPNPYDYFEEMSPLFVTTEVPFEKIGKHMQDHAKAENLSQKPRKLLVVGLRAEKILLMTPLLKWYISHGMLVTKVHQVIEYSKMACFKDFLVVLGLTAL